MTTQTNNTTNAELRKNVVATLKSVGLALQDNYRRMEDRTVDREAILNRQAEILDMLFLMFTARAMADASSSPATLMSAVRLAQDSFHNALSAIDNLEYYQQVQASRRIYENAKSAKQTEGL